MPFLKQQGAIIEYGGLAIDFPKQGIRINCTPTSGNIRVAVLITEDVMDQHREFFPEIIPEGLPPSAKTISLHVYDTLLPEGSGMVSDPYTPCPA